MRWLSTVVVAWAAGAALGARDAKAAEAGAEARLRDALRSATAQLRALQDERARWQVVEAEQKEALAAQLRAERTQANRQANLAKLLEQNPPAINELALSKVLPKAK